MTEFEPIPGKRYPKDKSIVYVMKPPEVFVTEVEWENAEAIGNILGATSVSFRYADKSLEFTLKDESVVSMQLGDFVMEYGYGLGTGEYTLVPAHEFYSQWRKK